MTGTGDTGVPGTGRAPDQWSAPGAAPPPSAMPPPSAAPPPGAATHHGGTAYPPSAAPPQFAAGHPAPVLGAPGPPPQHWTTALTAHKPGIIALRPLGFGDILEGSFAAVRRNPRTFFGLALLTTLAITLLGAAVGALGYLGFTQLDDSRAAEMVIAVGAIGGLTLVYVLSSVTGVVLTGMLSYPVGEAVLGRKPTLGETWRRTRGMVLRLSGLCLVLLVPVAIVLGGLIALSIWAFDRGSSGIGSLGLLGIALAVVGMVFLGIRLALATPALVLEDTGVIASLRRSWVLTAGRFWRTLGILFVAAILVGIVQQILGFGFQMLGMVLGLLVATTLSSDPEGTAFVVIMMGTSVVGALLAALLTQPFMAAVGALLYTDSRIRREGFDLALVRAATGAPGPR